MQEKTKLKFCSGVGTVTGANFLLTSPKGNAILIDCGLVQGDRVAMSENAQPFAYSLADVVALIITHAHLDHVGRIPKLVKDGFKGPIYSTPQTKALAEIVLNDAVNILEKEAREQNREPIYHAEDVAVIFDQWKTVEYHQNFQITDDISIFLKDAGHILGSAMVEVSVANQGRTLKIMFTGDLGNSPAPLLCDTEELGDANYLVMESVYGDRNHDSREGRLNMFEKIIKAAVQRGGALVIPAFSIDRTQTLLYELNNLTEEGRIPKVPVFVDSPMATKATEIYKENEHLFNLHVQAQIAKGDDVFSFPNLEYTMTSNDSKLIKDQPGPKIILAGSGMSVGGRVVGHEQHYLPDPKSTILLVGYQSIGSLGRHLSDGEKKVNINGQTIKIKAKIETLYGFSAHKDSDNLVSFVSTGTNNLKKVFVVMGEPRSSMHLSQRINDELSVKATVPEVNVEYELE